jgi:hypothetical protein
MATYVQRLKNAVDRKNKTMEDAAEKIRSVVQQLEMEGGLPKNCSAITELKYLVVDLEENSDEVK